MSCILINFKDKVDKYLRILAKIGMLSGLFSESDIPYLSYRVTENAFCYIFNARNVARDDSTIDAVVNNIYGISIKTFVHTNTMQKIAEFNSLSPQLRNYSDPSDIVIFVSKARNERIDFAKTIYNVKKIVYCCIVRRKNEILLTEEELIPIRINDIKITNTSKTSVEFEDTVNKYNFYYSKSVLFKKFNIDNVIGKISVSIIKNPFDLIEKIIELSIEPKLVQTKPFVILPLYSYDRKNKNVKYVPEKSGLNQWNAGGRKRDYNEVYIRIPSIINRKFPDFFPNRDTTFRLKLPNGEEIKAKVCQDNNKGLMSNPNSVLGKWILREVLNLKPGELVTIEKLNMIGIDSVIVTKEDDLLYSIDFRETGAYEKFIEQLE